MRIGEKCRHDWASLTHWFTIRASKSAERPSRLSPVGALVYHKCIKATWMVFTGDHLALQQSRRLVARPPSGGTIKVPRQERCGLATHIENLPMDMSRTLVAPKESDFGPVFPVQNDQNEETHRCPARTKLRP